MEKQQIIEKLENAIDELDYDKSSWIHKHVVIDMQEKSILFLKSLIILENKDLQEALNTSKKFLDDIEDFITRLNEGKV